MVGITNVLSLRVHRDVSHHTSSHDLRALYKFSTYNMDYFDKKDPHEDDAFLSKEEGSIYILFWPIWIMAAVIK